MSLKPHILETVYLEPCDTVQLICDDFFKETGLTYYNYVRIFDDTSRISLMNNRAWAEYIYKNHYKHQFTFEETFLATGNSSYTVWDNLSNSGKDSLLKVANEKYNIAHGFTIMTAYVGYVEFQYLATTRDNLSINHFYVNNLDALQNFSIYFREQAHEIISMSEQHRLNFQNRQPFWLKKDLDTGSYGRKHDSPNLCETKVSRYYLSGELRDVYLTVREAQCLTAMLEGLTAKESGKILDISYKTVQIHLNNIKLKFNCQRKSQLMNLAYESGFRMIANNIRLRYF